MSKNIVIIGAGPAGYNLALNLSKENNIKLIDTDNPGGTCLYRGCIPTKTLLELSKKEKDLDVIKSKKDDIISTLSNNLINLIKSRENIEIIKSSVEFIDDKTISVNNQNMKFDILVIATGSKPFINFDIKGVGNIYTSDELLDLNVIPKELIIIGAGAVGLEFAEIYKNLGSKVKILAYEFLDGFDRDIVSRVIKYLKENSIEVIDSVEILELKNLDDRVDILANYKKREVTYSSSSVLIATGRSANIDKLCLQKTSINYSDRGIEVDEKFQTNVENIFAIGDVVKSNILLAHVAENDGNRLAKYLDFGEIQNRPAVVSSIYLDLEISKVGFSSNELEELNIKYDTVKLPYRSNSKAVALDNSQGLVKMLFNDNQILGMQAFGKDAEQLVMLANMAITNNLSIDELSNMIYPHPTFIELFKNICELAKNRRKSEK